MLHKKIITSKDASQIIDELKNGNKKMNLWQRTFDESSISVMQDEINNKFIVKRRYNFFYKPQLLLFGYSVTGEVTREWKSNTVILSCKMNTYWYLIIILPVILLLWWTIFLVNLGIWGNWDLVLLPLIWLYLFYGIMIYATRFYMHELLERVTKIINQ